MKVNGRRQDHWSPTLKVGDHSESKCSHFSLQTPAILLLKWKWHPQSAALVRFQKPSLTRMVRGHLALENQIPDGCRPRRLAGYLKRSKQPFDWAHR